MNGIQCLMSAWHWPVAGGADGWIVFDRWRFHAVGPLPQTFFTSDVGV
jgi:hypothetical protein